MSNTSISEYARNLVAFAHEINLAQPLAKIGWISSTPMHFDMHLNANVDAYNQAAADALRLHVLPGPGALVDAFIDAHSAITGACGSPPYYGPHACPNCSHHCPLINPDEEYHYNAQGYTVLAGAVADGIRHLLASGQYGQQKDKDLNRTNKHPNHSHHHYNFLEPHMHRCDDNKTACPAHMSCVHDKYSKSSFGCCPVPNGSGCGDGFHCCGNFTTHCQGNGTNPPTPGQPLRPGVYSHVCVT